MSYLDHTIARLKGAVIDPGSPEFEKLSVFLDLMDIFLFPEALTPTECEKIISYYDANEHKAGRGYEYSRNENRQGKVLSIHRVEDREFDQYVFKIVGRIIAQLFEKLQRHFTVNDCGYSICEYISGEGVDHHIDGLFDPSRDSPNPRAFSVIMFLQDVELGGETFFYRKNVSVKPRQGSVLVFPGHADTHPHSVNPVQLGRRLVLTTWLHNEDYEGRPVERSTDAS